MSFGAVPQTIAVPAEALDSLTRVTALLDRAEPRVRRRFISLVNAAQEIGTLEEIADLLERGQVDEALAVSNGVADGLATSLEAAYAAAGLSAAEVLRSQTDTLFDFNATNLRSVETLRRERLRLVREFNGGQRAATQAILQDAFERGLAPVQQARALRGSIGLTASQAETVIRLRRSLEQGTRASLNRVLGLKLRDRRFDPSIRAALRGERTLAPAQIDRMVQRYEERFVAFRARTIARTETVAAVGAGDLELWDQAVESGIVAPTEVISRWKTAKDERVRSSHRAMDGQEQPFGEPFLSGAGNTLRFPGDPLGPASDTVNCRCVVGRALRRRTTVRVDELPRLAAG